jgi:hypothetical protein
MRLTWRGALRSWLPGSAFVTRLHAPREHWRASGPQASRPRPPKYRNEQARRQADAPDADFNPLADRRGISINQSLRPAHEKPINNIRVEVGDFSLDEPVPQLAAAIEGQIDSDDARDYFIKEKMHSKTDFSSAGCLSRDQRFDSNIF